MVLLWNDLSQPFVGYTEQYPHLLLRSMVCTYAHTSKYHFCSVTHDALDSCWDKKYNILSEMVGLKVLRTVWKHFYMEKIWKDMHQTGRIMNG